MKKLYSVIFATLTCLISVGQTTKEIKQDTTKQKINKLSEVIVTGNHKTDPVLTTVSNDYEKNVVQPKNVADLFNGINGFSVIKRGNYAIDPSFRASQYEQLNIQYDGGTKAMHACPNRMDPITTHVTPEEISKIEIIKGPFTVRYGATFGGIVNMVSQKPDYLDRGLHGTVSAGYETNGNALVNMFQLHYIQNKYDMVGNFGYRNFGNYQDGNGIEIPSSFKSTDYGLKFGYNITKNQRLQAHWRQSFGRDILHAALPMDSDYDNSSIMSLDYNLSEISESVKSFSAKAYYSFVDHFMNNFDRPSFMMMEATSAVEATTIGGKMEINWKPTNAINVFSGIDVMHIARTGGRTRMVKRNMMGAPLENPMVFNDNVWQDAFINDFGAFTEAKWTLTPTALLTTGLRYDMVKSNANDPADDFATRYHLEEKTDNNFSGTVSIKKLVSDYFTIEAAYGRGVRSANMVERYINHFTVGQDPYEYLGNPNLKPEANNQFEIGFKGKTAHSVFKYSANFYYSKFENYIVAVIDPNISRKYMPMAEPRHVKVFRNLSDTYKTGFETMAQIRFLNGFNFKTELAYVYAKNNDLKESLPLTPPFITNFSLGLKKESYWATINYNVTSRQEHIAPSFGETVTDGYETLDLRLGFKPIKKLSVGLAALNIFDENYNNHLNFSFTNQEDFGRTPITEPGRNFSAFVKYKF
ncbi:TonB-dependent receptor [Flavobacteriaceae bacterium GSB9]|nr:TonB-dependent receptor [Flavobacteriaceae bacterium GSB9]